MLALSIISLLVAVAGVVIAGCALHLGNNSAKDSKLSADAAKESAAAAVISADAARSEDHRQRSPTLEVTVEKKVPHDHTEAIYRVTNRGPTDLDAVRVHRPILGEADGLIVHQVSPTGHNDYSDVAELGPIPSGTSGRFTLSLGSAPTLPTFMVKIVSSIGDETWPATFDLDAPRLPAPDPPRRIR